MAKYSWNRTDLIILVYFAFAILLGEEFSAQTYEPTFSQLSTIHGLSQNTVTCILQDSRGFLWLGTKDGLNRYDGYSFEVFRNDPKNNFSISENSVTALAEDIYGDIWIGTLNGTVSRYDYATRKFFSYKIKTHPVFVLKQNLPEAPSSFGYYNENTITSLCCDKTGNIWTGTWGKGLFKYDAEKGNFSDHFFSSNEDNSISSDFILSIIRDKDGNIWIGTFGGGINNIIYSAEKKNKVSNYTIKRFPELLKVFPGASYIMSMFADKYKENKIWIASYGSGLFAVQYSKTNEMLVYLKNHSGDKILSGGKITTLVQDPDSSLWIGTLGNGLLHYIPSNNTLRKFVYDQYKKNSINDNDIISLKQDKTGLLWIGTSYGYGLNKLNPKKLRFDHFAKNQYKGSLSDNIINCFLEDSDNNIWIGTYRGGLNKLNKQLKNFTSLTSNPTDKNSLSSNHITALCSDGPNLWIGTYDAGLNYYSQRERKLVRFSREMNNKNSLSDNRITSIVNDKNGSIWIGTFNGGITRLSSLNNGELFFKRFIADTLFPGNISDNRVSTLYADRNGNIWAALFNNDLFLLKKEEEEFQRTQVLHTDKKDLTKFIVTVIYDDRTGNIWAGTNGTGLYRLDKNTQKSYHQNILGEKIIYGILEDEFKNIWLSTNKGIIKYNYINKSFRVFNLSDESDIVFTNAAMRTTEGELFFGSIDGFYSFYPGKIEDDRFKSKTLITRITTSGGEFNPELPVELPYNKNDISFHFSNMDFKNPGLNYYKYKLSGYDNEWQVISDGKHSASYFNLPHGEYRLIVKGSNSSGMWSSEESTVLVIISSPFWRTWWFIGLSILFLTGILIYIISGKLKQHREVERIKMKLSADLHDSVGSGLTEIALLSEVMLATEKPSEKIKEKIDLIIRRSHELIENMSDIVWMVNPVPGSLYDLILRLKDIYFQLLESKGIQLKIIKIEESNSINLTLEQRQNIYLIFKEAINNSVKYSCSKNLMLSVEYSNGLLEITFRDDGKGFDLSKNYSGNGLKNMKQRAKSIKCELEIFSSEAKGTIVILSCRM